jgi:Helix-turn-helix domain
MKPEPPDERLLVTMTVGELRELVRVEIEAAKKQELPRLLYDTHEAAEILGLPASWLAARARAGEVRVTRKGHYVLFSLADLQEFADRSDGVDTPEG